VRKTIALLMELEPLLKPESEVVVKKRMNYRVLAEMLFFIHLTHGKRYYLDVTDSKLA
jgi:hypothetical protein